MKLDESLELYIKQVKFGRYLSQNTVKSYKRDVDNFIKFIRHKRVYQTNKINLDLFREYLKFLDKFKYANRTIIRLISSLKNYFKFLEDNNLIDQTLSQAINAPRKVHRFYSYLSIDEVKKLFAVMKPENGSGMYSQNSLRDRAAMELTYSTGCRVSEVQNIKIEDINISKNEILVTGKGNKQRIVYLNQKALFWLKRYLKARNNSKDNHLFLNKSGNRLSDRSLRTIFKNCIYKAGIEKNLSIHSLRHSFASHLLQEGAGIREVQELLGHANVATTEIYTHINIKKLKEDYIKYHPRA